MTSIEWVDQAVSVVVILTARLIATEGLIEDLIGDQIPNITRVPLSLTSVEEREMEEVIKMMTRKKPIMAPKMVRNLIDLRCALSRRFRFRFRVGIEPSFRLEDIMP